jgi:hypothetical protein
MNAEPFLAVLQLDTRFPRYLGDIGHPGSVQMPVRHYVVQGAAPASIVQPTPQDWLPQFVSVAKQSQADGAGWITTSCGFLATYQLALEQALNIPVITSSLLQFASLEQRFGVGTVGVLTMSSAALSTAVKNAANLTKTTPVCGMLETGPGEFTRSILENHATLEKSLAQREVLGVCKVFVTAHPQLKALLLECTNLGPYRAAIAQSTDLPVFDLISLIHQKFLYA